MKKIVFATVAIAALALAACGETTETPVDANATATADVQLNADGSVKTDATEAAPTAEATTEAK